MKKSFLFLILLSLLFITSCELYMDEPSNKGKIYAIHIALDYQNSSYKNLSGTIPDARELQKALAAVALSDGREYQDYLMIQEGSTPDMLDAHYPSKINVENYLVGLKAIANEDDLTILTYSGHGEDKSGDLMLAKTTPSSPISMSASELLILMNDIPGRKLVILDSCYSGMFVEKSPSSTNTLLDNSISTFFETYHSSSTYEKPDLFVLTASAHADSYEMEFGTGSDTHHHGVFTYTLLEALGWNHPHTRPILPVTIQDPPAAKGGRITVDGLFRYIKKNQGIPTRLKLFSKWTEHQHPTTTGGPMDFVLFKL